MQVLWRENGKATRITEETYSEDHDLNICRDFFDAFDWSFWIWMDGVERKGYFTKSSGDGYVGGGELYDDQYSLYTIPSKEKNLK